MVFWNESLNTFAALWLETLIRACWQGGLALALVWAACRLLPRLPAAGKCWLWRLAYLKLLIAFLWLPTLDLPLLPSPGLPPAAELPTLAVEPPPAADAISTTPSTDTLPTVALEPPPTADVMSTAPPAEALPAENAPTLATSSDVVASAVAPSAVTPTVAGWLLLLWTGALLWQGGQAIRQGMAVRRLRRSGTPLDGGQLDFWNVALSRDLKLPMVPCLLSSNATNTPLLIGILRPCILLPASLLSTCTPDELRLILAHELAHVRRRDLLWGWLPLLAGLICGFHPLVRVAGHELGMAQEIACDEAALHLTGAASAAYGSLLVRVAACFAPHPSRGFGMIGMTESYHTLKRRLSAMKSFPSAPRQYRVAVRFGLLSLGLASLLPWRVAAQSTPLPPAPAAPVNAPVPTMPDSLPTAPPTPAAPAQAPVPTSPGPGPGPAATPTPAAPAQVPGAPPAIGAAPVTVPGLPATPALPGAPAARVSAPRAQTVRGRVAAGPIPRANEDTAADTTVAVTISKPGQQERTVIMRIDPRTTRTITVQTTPDETPEEAPEESATVGYPAAAPGMVAPARRTSTPSSRAMIVSPRNVTRSVQISGAPGTRTRTITRTSSGAATDPFVQVNPPAAASDPTTPRRARADRASRTGRATAVNPPVPGMPGPEPKGVTDPSVRPAAPSVDPLSPPPPIGIPGGPTPPAAAPGARSGSVPVPPTPATAPPSALPGGPSAGPVPPVPPAPKALPGDPGGLPPTPAPKAVEPQSVGASPTSRSVPILGDLPILGHLFRFETKITVKAPTASRSVPILGDLPFLGHLFRFETKITPAPEKSER